MWTDQLLRVARAYAEWHDGLDLRTVSSRVFDDGKILPRIADGSGTVTLTRAEKALAWFSAHWPETAVWPEGVRRPVAAPSHSPKTDSPVAQLAPAQGVEP